MSFNVVEKISINYFIKFTMNFTAVSAFIVVSVFVVFVTFIIFDVFIAVAASAFVFTTLVAVVVFVATFVNFVATSVDFVAIFIDFITTSVDFVFNSADFIDSIIKTAIDDDFVVDSVIEFISNFIVFVVNSNLVFFDLNSTISAFIHSNINNLIHSHFNFLKFIFVFMISNFAIRKMNDFTIFISTQRIKQKIVDNFSSVFSKINKIQSLQKNKVIVI